MAKSAQAYQAVILLFGQVIATLAEALVPLFIVRLLPKAEVGILTETLLIYATVALIATNGLPGTLSYHLPSRSRAERAAISRRVTGLLVAIGLATGAVMAAVGVIGAASQASPTWRYLGYLALLPVGDIPVRMLPNLLVIEDRPRAAAAIGVIRALVMIGAVLVPLLGGMDIDTIPLVLNAVGGLYLALTLWALYVIYRGVERQASPVGRWQAMRFALPLGLTQIVGNLNRHTDRLIIALLFSEVIYAEYQAGSWQLPLIPSITYAVSVTYSPLFTSLFREGRAREVVRVWRAQSVKTALIVVPISAIFAVAAEETVELLFTASYAPAANVFRCYSIMTMARITAYGSIPLAAGHPQYIARASTITLIFNLITSLALVAVLGVIGPAIATLLSMIPMVLIYIYYISQCTGVRFREVFPLREYLQVVAVCALGCAGAIAFKLLVPASAAVSLAAQAGITTAVFALVGTLTGIIEADDWRFLVGWLSQLIKKPTNASSDSASDSRPPEGRADGADPQG
ncbi:MAG: hypothetical protein Tsb0020_00380 [Haliangiales bacterium]